MTRSKTNWTLPKLIIPVVTLLVIIGVVAGLGHPALAQITYGPYGPVSVPLPPRTYTYTLYWNLTDARLEYGATPTSCPSACYTNLINYMAPWYFTAGKSFSIYIANASDVYYYTSSGWQLGSPITMTATATANSTGGVTWTVSTTLTGGITPNQVYANWTVVVVLNGYGGANWMVFNVTSIFMDLADLMGNLTTVSTDSYIPVSPSIAQSLIPQLSTTYTGTSSDYPTIGVPWNSSITSEPYVAYPLFRPVYGGTPTSYYVVLPDLYFFFLYVGATTSNSEIQPLSPTSQLEASVTLGTGVTVFGPTTYNSTVSGVSQAIYGYSYTGFGPIYYVTNEFSGLNSADHNYPSVTAQPITITVSEVYPSGQSVVLYNYTTANVNNATTPESFNVAKAYTWNYTGTSAIISLSALCNTTTTGVDPALLVGVPVVEFYLGNVTDLKGNLIIGNATYIPNPILAEKLYVKWLLATTPTATVVSENYLRYYESTPAYYPWATSAALGLERHPYRQLDSQPQSSTYSMRTSRCLRPRYLFQVGQRYLR
ncbi:hypothetical protein [Vulcanisaeta sp. JCM 16159]|uniref:hypothetical protein n=1 Tax=Vulcanisaeta sp. JCM 16159 TaxID=1295371 RepID=UPI0006D28B73|nr:hypothetical protein [Vulcanisaeta sp. JCM 16159]